MIIRGTRHGGGRAGRGASGRASARANRLVHVDEGRPGAARPRRGAREVGRLARACANGSGRKRAGERFIGFCDREKAVRDARATRESTWLIRLAVSRGALSRRFVSYEKNTMSRSDAANGISRARATQSTCPARDATSMSGPSSKRRASTPRVAPTLPLWTARLDPGKRKTPTPFIARSGTSENEPARPVLAPTRVPSPRRPPRGPTPPPRRSSSSRGWSIAPRRRERNTRRGKGTLPTPKL